MTKLRKLVMSVAIALSISVTVAPMPATKAQEVIINEQNICITETLTKTLEKKKDQPSYSKDDLRYLSAIIWAEASNQCYAGKKAVGIVVVNRVNSKKFPSTVYKVITQKHQFTPVSNGSFKKALKKYDKGTLDKDCIKAAKEALSKDTKIKYKKKTYDMKKYLFFSRRVKGYKVQIQDHQFK